MAHNTHIPWTLLSTHLKFTPSSTHHNGRTDLYPRFLPSQGSEITHFTQKFASVLSSFSSSERSKHPSSPITTPSSETILISPSLFKKIEKTVKNYRGTSRIFTSRSTCDAKCGQWGDEGCFCPISELTAGEEWKMGDFVRGLRVNPSSSSIGTAGGWGGGNYHLIESPDPDILETTKTLLLHGEMGVLLKITSHPAIVVADLWNLPWCCGAGDGIGALMRGTLMSYLFLNAVFLFPETWEGGEKKRWVEEKRKKGGVYYGMEEMDYRKMKAWERMLSRCTGRKTYEVQTFPHRLFFGVDGAGYDGENWNREGCGRVFDDPVVLGVDGKLGGGNGERYLPSSEDVEMVLFYLRKKGIPTELGVKIITYADYKAERRLKIPNDPLHEENREELVKYLSWCWKVLVWCDVLMSEGGMKIDWVGEVAEVIRALWDSEKDGGRKMSRYLGIEEQNELGIVMSRHGEELLGIPGGGRVVFV